MRDVYYTLNRQGLWVFKALTPKAEKQMKKHLEVSLPGEVFLHCKDKDFQFTLNALRADGLQTEEDVARPVDVSALTDF